MYWGKIIGTLAGLATSKPLLALLGLFLGHQFDRGFASRSQTGSKQQESFIGLNDGFVKALFQCMGYLAKIDGRVTEDEIRATRAVMHRIGLGPAQVQQAIAWFNTGKEPGFALQQALQRLCRDSAKSDDARRVFVRLVLEVSLAKPRLHKPERAAIWSICTELGIGRVELAQMEAMIRAQKSFRRSPAGDVDTARIKAAYETLGVTQAASNAEIKKAYRRLVNRNHPDKIAASKPEPAVLAEAERRTREVLNAYELLKIRRSIR